MSEREEMDLNRLGGKIDWRQRDGCLGCYKPKDDKPISIITQQTINGE